MSHHQYITEDEINDGDSSGFISLNFHYNSKDLENIEEFKKLLKSRLSGIYVRMIYLDPILFNQFFNLPSNLLYQINTDGIEVLYEEKKIITPIDKIWRHPIDMRVFISKAFRFSKVIAHQCFENDVVKNVTYDDFSCKPINVRDEILFEVKQEVSIREQKFIKYIENSSVINWLISEYLILPVDVKSIIMQISREYAPIFK
jgi:hypothetical protein